MHELRSRWMEALAVSAAVWAISCGGGTTPPAEPAPAPAEAPPPPPPPPPPPAESAPAAEAPAPEPAKPAWADMNKDQRLELMKTVVMPNMKTAFQEVDAKRYADMNCTTCHGPGAKEGKFTMPNPKLPKLDVKDGFAKHKKKNAKVVEFMMTRVVPDMAKFLGTEPYNPETQQGFGCFNCHTQAGK